MKKIIKQIDKTMYSCDYCNTEWEQEYTADLCEKRCIKKKCSCSDIYYRVDTQNYGDWSANIYKTCRNCGDDKAFHSFDDITETEEFAKDLYNLISKHDQLQIKSKLKKDMYVVTENQFNS